MKKTYKIVMYSADTALVQYYEDGVAVFTGCINLFSPEDLIKRMGEIRLGEYVAHSIHDFNMVQFLSALSWRLQS